MPRWLSGIVFGLGPKGPGFDPRSGPVFVKNNNTDHYTQCLVILCLKTPEICLVDTSIDFLVHYHLLLLFTMR